MSLLAHASKRTKDNSAPTPRVRCSRCWTRVERTRFRDPQELIQLHETVLYLRAYPQNAQVLRLADRILFSFRRTRARMPREEFEYSDVSGIAGTALTTNFSYPFAQSLAERHAGCVSIDWEQYQHADRLGPILARLIPESFEDWAVAPHPDWRHWYEKRRRHSAVADATASRPKCMTCWSCRFAGRWAIRRRPVRARAFARKKIFYHDGPFLARKDVSIEAEFAAPRIAAQRLPRAEAQRMIDIIIDASAVRYRELYGFLYPDAANVFHADLGRGMDFYFFGVARKWRLPQRDYSCGMYFKNGVPIGYVEVLWPRQPKGGRMEVGFNLYYTFRQGETAWLYARLLKLLP